ncbi:MAG: ABC transporter permease, partial [Abyssibacter sp.]
GLAAHLQEQGFELETLDPELDILQAIGDHDAILRPAADFQASLRAGQPAQIELVLDTSKTSSQSMARRVEQAMAVWSGELASLRLMALGVSPQAAQPIEMQRRDVASRADRAALVLSGFQVFVLIAAFFGSMHVCIDATAGERERRSLEALLVQPVSAFSLVVGKWLVAAGYGLFGVALTLTAMGILLPMAPLGELGISYQPTPQSVLTMFALIAPLALLASGLQMLAASYAKSFKEAQTYLSLLMFVPMVPAMAVSFLQLDAEPWMFAVPVLGQQQLLSDALREVPPDLLSFGIATSVVVGAGLVCVLITARLYGSERMLRGL